MKLRRELSVAAYQARLALRNPAEIRAALQRREQRREDARSVAHFHLEEYLTMNARRLEHLASLELPVAERSVLEVGAGIGDLTSFFLNRGCSVLVTEGRRENLRVLRQRLPEVESELLDLNQSNEGWRRTADIVFCYGTLYHLEHPARALALLARCCTGMLLLETCVSPHEGIAQNPVPEAAESPTQAVSGTGCRPTRAWLRQELGRHFQHVYFTRTQPWHEQFPSDWSNPPPGLTRAVAVASRESLESAKLTTEIPMLQERH